MNEEMMMTTTMEENTNAETTENYGYYEETDNSDNGLGMKLLLGGVAAVGAGIAAWKATKKKREEWQIKRMEKKGYQVTKIEEDEAKKVVVHKVENVSEDEESEE